MPQPRPGRLAERVAASAAPGAVITDGARRFALEAAAGLTAPSSLEGACVLVRTPDPLSAAVALLALDGLAARIVLAPPDLDAGHLGAVLEDAGVQAVIHGADPATGLEVSFPAAAPGERRPCGSTEWVLFTSGTSGRPKMVIHTLAGLVPSLAPNRSAPPVWATFYDIRRFGGLQMFLRAVVAGGSMVLGRAGETLDGFLDRAGAAGVTHLSGTPSHWRQALLAPALDQVDPGYVRLSGEIVDQAILDRLRERFPGAAIGHAFASTEAGVGFEVEDGGEGFPASYLDRVPPAPQLRIRDGVLEIRSHRTALGYVGAGAPLLRRPDGFVATGDMVEIRDGRCRFMGRRDGVVNVGGLKIHPEEVEGVINRTPGVRACVVLSRRNPITGAVVTAEVVAEGTQDRDLLKARILDACRRQLAPHKVPATLRFVDSLGLSPGGKLVRRHA